MDDYGKLRGIAGYRTGAPPSDLDYERSSEPMRRGRGAPKRKEWADVLMEALEVIDLEEADLMRKQYEAEDSTAGDGLPLPGGLTAPAGGTEDEGDEAMLMVLRGKRKQGMGL